VIFSRFSLSLSYFIVKFDQKRESMLSKKRPFVPTKADDIRIGDIIKFSRPGGKISKGMVKYIGPLPDRHDVYFGLELDSEGEFEQFYINFLLRNCKTEI
jgi:hypothetical protein